MVMHICSIPTRSACLTRTKWLMINRLSPACWQSRPSTTGWAMRSLLKPCSRLPRQKTSPTVAASDPKSIAWIRSISKACLLNRTRVIHYRTFHHRNQWSKSVHSSTAVWQLKTITHQSWAQRVFLRLRSTDRMQNFTSSPANSSKNSKTFQTKWKLPGTSCQIWVCINHTNRPHLLWKSWVLSKMSLWACRQLA